MARRHFEGTHMQPKPTPNFDNELEAVRAGITEANRRQRGDFDGLLGGFDRSSSRLLRDLLAHLRDYLLDRYTDHDARHLLSVFEPKPGFRNMPIIGDDVLLAIDLLNTIRSAARCEDEEFANLILGVRDAKRQAGTRKAGKTRGEQKRREAVAQHRKWRSEADKLVASGTDPRNVAGILADRHGVHASTIRRGLEKSVR